MAEETFELYSLTSKLTMDTSQFDRAYTESQRKMKTLSGDMRQLDTAARTGGGGVSSLSGALSGLMPQLSGLGGPAGAIGIVTTGLTLYATALTVTAKGVWDLTSTFSDMGSELKDLSDQVNFSTETLGVFQGAGRMVGVEVEQLSTGLVTFQKNLAGGNDALKALNVTSKDNETALRQTLAALANVNDKTLQTALAQEIFGKSGKAMLAIVKETGGDFDASADKLRKWNVLMSDQAVAIADEFGDKLGELGLRFQGIGNTIAMETAPAFIAAFDQIAAALEANTVDWRWWGEQLGNIIVSSTAIIAGFVKAVESMDYNFNPGAFIMVWKEGMDQAIAEMNAKRRELLAPIPEGMGGGRVPGPTIDWKPGGSKEKKKGKSDEEREAERREKARGEAVARLNSEIKKYEDQLKGVDVTTRAYALSQERLNGIWKDASQALYDQALAQAKAADNRQKQLELQQQLTEYIKQQDAAVRLAVSGEQSFLEKNEELIRSLERQGAILQDATKEWLRFAGVMQDAFANIAKLQENIDKTTANFPLPEIVFPTKTEDEIARSAGDAANREAGIPPPVMKLDPLVKWRIALEDFSQDITFTIDDAIRAGFEDGIDAGIKEFARGLLEMARHEALQALQRAIFNVLNPGKATDQEGGGGFWSQAIKFGVSALGALFGGGGSSGGLGSASAGAIGGFAKGGYASPGSWYFAGEGGPGGRGELIKAGPGGDTIFDHDESMAMLAGAGGPTINIYAQDVRAAFSRETMTQARSRLKRLQRGR